MKDLLLTIALMFVAITASAQSGFGNPTDGNDHGCTDPGRGYTMTECTTERTGWTLGFAGNTVYLAPVYSTVCREVEYDACGNRV